MTVVRSPPPTSVMVTACGMSGCLACLAASSMSIRSSESLSIRSKRESSLRKSATVSSKLPLNGTSAESVRPDSAHDTVTVDDTRK